MERIFQSSNIAYITYKLNYYVLGQAAEEVDYSRISKKKRFVLASS